jgi:isoleucyl-tRNA synthetase
MVNRILSFETDIGAGDVDQVVDTKTPRSDQVFEILEIWFDSDEAVEYSLTIRERKLIDSLPASEAPNRDLPLPFDLVVEEGDELTIQASETAGNAANPKAYMRIEERSG